jgi:hypothetical protein
VVCSAEFPRVEKLIGQYKDRPDVQFISFDSDANPGVVQPYAKEHALSFVVIPAHSYAQKLDVTVPSIWIVDAAGVVRLKESGYYTTERWETAMTDAIEKVKRGAAAAR